ncbi:Aminopeptidase Y (Arg, Lys, Leu preference) [Euzebya pacifica]|uniref:Aminopeptidase Y (Arg, Lys, Leu preference) n=1 Tax=Euzebya pacifica TaxID=1608957 RepID=A0A346Y3W1_9ACTN|nr:Aminopeptidase Y (Arg, Lys, Leu preference) [Euzebya pacifica]
MFSSAATAVFLVLALGLAVLPASAIEVIDSGDTVPAIRLLGDSRFETAADIATDDSAQAAEFETGTVIVALGDNFPDALAATYAAGLEEAPILLAQTTDLPAATTSALEELAPERILLIGGTAAVNADVEAELATHGEVTRVAGTNRDETALEVARLGDADADGTLDNGATTAIVASSGDFVGAVVAGPVSAAAGWPLILTNPDELSPAASTAITELGITDVIVAGGPAYVSNDVAGALTALDGVSVSRILGASPGLLSAQMARFAESELGFTSGHANIATGEDFADALAIGAHAALDHDGPSPVLLTEGDELGEHATAYLTERATCAVRNIHIAGGTAAVSDEVVEAARAAATRAEACTDSEIVVARADVNGGMEVLEAFQAIADSVATGTRQEGEELIGNRASGTEGYDLSVDYVLGELEDTGFEVTTQEFAFSLFEELEPTVVAIDGEELTEEQASIMSYSGSGDVTGVTELVDADLGAGNPGTGEANDGDSDSGCEIEDFDGFTEGNIALIQRGGCAFAVKAANALEAGAAAAIVFNQGSDEGTQDVVLGTLGGEVDPDFVSIGMDFATGLALAGDPDAEVTIEATTAVTPQTSSNVIADWPGTDPDNVVMVGAHLDSVPEGPGINDNGSGSAAILEVAREIAANDIVTENTVRFAWWGAEESGLVGSDSYVFGDGDMLEGISDEEYERIKLYLNFDMVASPNFMRGVYDGDGDAFELEGPPGSDDIETAFEDFFESIGVPSVPTEFSGRSDYQAFISVGIPAGGLFTGAEGVKTEEEAELFGGAAGVAYDPCYHAACDDIDNLDLGVFGDNIGAIASVTMQYANSLDGIPARDTGESFAAAAAAHDASVHVGFDADHAHGHGDYNNRFAS